MLCNTCRCTKRNNEKHERGERGEPGGKNTNKEKIIKQKLAKERNQELDLAVYIRRKGREVAKPHLSISTPQTNWQSLKKVPRHLKRI